MHKNYSNRTAPLKKGRKPVKTEEKDEVSQVGTQSKEDRRWEGIVGNELDIGRMTVYRLDRAVEAIDSLTANGKREEAEAVRQALNKSPNAGYEKAVEVTPPRPQVRKKDTPHRKGAGLLQEARKLLGKHAPRSANANAYDMMVRLFDQLTRSERALFLNFVQSHINLRVSVPTPPPETRH